MLTLYYPNIAAMLVFSLFGGEILIFFLIRTFISPKAKFSFDASGMLERTLLFAAILAGGWYVYSIPFIIMARVLSVMSGRSFKNFSDLIRRKEPALEFQKIRIKSEMGITLITSPVIGLLMGILAKTLL